MGNSNNDCPYQRVEYLEVKAEDGRTYVDTGIVPTGADNNFYLGFMPITMGQYAGAFQAYAKDASDMFGQIAYGIDANSWELHTYNGQIGYQSVKFAVQKNNYYDVVIERDKVSYNGETQINNRIAGNSPDDHMGSIYLFDRPGRAANSLRIYYFKWSKGNETLRDFIPVRVGDEGFMYDRVSGKLFGNVGDGKFILGPDL